VLRAERVRFWTYNALYVSILLGIRACQHAGPERWWWSTLNLYLPQWLWAVPGLGLGIAAALRVRSVLWLPMLSVAYVAGPMMGFNFPSAVESRQQASEALRVMTFNAAQNANQAAVLQVIAQTNPDLLFLQESGTLPASLRQALPAYHVVGEGACVIVSRFPLSHVETQALPAMRYGSAFTRCEMQLGATKVTVYNLHLETARAGLGELFNRGLSGLPYFDRSAALRVKNAALIAARLRAEQGPLLVGGDFNAPSDSLIYRAIQGGTLVDLFKRSGWGYGYTYGHGLPVQHSYVRLDHLLASANWTSKRCWTGTAAASDHRPLIADLELSSGAGGSSNSPQ
jgi:endonuclease/exonuclease/phosphatase (EEP) superfamily protein YafD